EGGMGTITQAMARAAVDKGVDIRVNAEVDRILVDAGRVAGVRLTNGEEVRADRVVSNADPKRTFLQLLDPHDVDVEFRTNIESLSPRTTYLKFHAVMNRLPDISRYLGREASPREHGYITIAESLEQYRTAFEQMSRGEPSTNPIVHLQIPTVYDATLTSRDG